MPAKSYKVQQDLIAVAVETKRQEFADLYALPRRRFAALVVCGVRYGVKFGDFHDIDTMLETLERRQQISKT